MQVLSRTDWDRAYEPRDANERMKFFANGEKKITLAMFNKDDKQKVTTLSTLISEPEQAGRVYDELLDVQFLASHLYLWNLETCEYVKARKIDVTLELAPSDATDDMLGFWTPDEIRERSNDIFQVNLQLQESSPNFDPEGAAWLEYQTQRLVAAAEIFQFLRTNNRAEEDLDIDFFYV